jgi:hypothetical protein
MQQDILPAAFATSFLLCQDAMDPIPRTTIPIQGPRQCSGVGWVGGPRCAANAVLSRPEHIGTPCFRTHLAVEAVGDAAVPGDGVAKVLHLERALDAARVEAAWLGRGCGLWLSTFDLWIKPPCLVTREPGRLMPLA